MLHITNGTSVSIARTGLPGDVLAWVDVLHEGPVPSGLPLEQLTPVRTKFLRRWGPGGDLTARDARLAQFQRDEEVILWFEHDLYDQLQLIQILDWFAARELDETRLSLICIGEFPGKARFHGLGELTPEELLTLFPKRHPVSAAELGLARAAWAAFRSADPSRIESVLAGDTSALPYLQAALVRHLQQFPSRRNGLSRSEQQILEILSAGVESFPAAFSAAAAREEVVFLGDTVFKSYLDRMRDGPAPLLDGMRLTPVGQDVLLGRSDAVALNGIDRWLGGVHLSGHEAEWRWDTGRRKLARKESASADRR